MEGYIMKVIANHLHIVTQLLVNCHFYQTILQVACSQIIKLRKQDTKNMETSTTLTKSNAQIESATIKRGEKKKKQAKAVDQQQSQNHLKRQRPSTLQKQQVKKEKIKKRVNKKQEQSESESSEQDTQSSSEQSQTKAKKNKIKQETKYFEQIQRKKTQRKITKNKQRDSQQIKCQNSKQSKYKKKEKKQKNSSKQIQVPALKSKSKAKVQKRSKPKPKQKQESINEIMQQYAKISRKKKRKSNFYLDRLDSLKWGEPVGRGSKKQREKLEERQRLQRQRQKERKKRVKQMIIQLCRPFNKNAEKQAKIQQVEVIEDIEIIKQEQTNKLSCKTQEQIERKISGQNLYPAKNHIVNDQNQNIKQNQSEECKIQKSNNSYIDSHFSNIWIHQHVQKSTIMYIRSELKNIFSKILNLIELQNPEKTPFTQKQKVIITRQLLRQNKYNRLFKENKLLAESILKIMYSVNNKDSQIEIATMNSDLLFIWTALNKFINGVEARKEGYSLNRLVLCKNIYESEKVDAECFYACQFLSELNDNTLLKQWSKDQEKTLIQLYSYLPYEQLIIEFNLKYGNNKKWQDKSQIQSKVNQLTLRGLAILYDLTKPIVLGDQQNSNSTANILQVSLKQYQRLNRSCQLGIFANYGELILKLVELDESMVNNVKKKLLFLNIKSSKNEISEAVKAISNFLKIEQLLLLQNSSNQQNRQQNNKKQKQERLLSESKNQTTEFRNA